MFQGHYPDCNEREEDTENFTDYLTVTTERMENVVDVRTVIIFRQ